MKRTPAILAAAAMLFSSGCQNEVFYNIRQDVAPEEATISGQINSIARYSTDRAEYIVLAANGGLRYKTTAAENESHGKWESYGYENLPFDEHKYDYYDKENHTGQQILKVLADSGTLYLVSAEYTKDTEEGTSAPSQINLYAKKIQDDGNGKWNSAEGGDLNGWTQLAKKLNADNSLFKFGKNSSGYYVSDFNVFSTNSVKSENRKAYIRSGSGDSAKYYRLDGISEPEEFSPSAADSGSGSLNSAVIFKGEEIFFASLAAVTNETSTSDATAVYYGNGDKLKYSTDGTTFTDAGFGTGQTITCLAPCADSILIGRGSYYAQSSSASGGIARTTLDSSGIPDSSLKNFETNAESQLSSSYFIFTLLNTDPSRNEKDSAIYASIGFIGSGSSSAVTFGNMGLWSYYSSRGNWNRE